MSLPTCWQPSQFAETNALCLGTGRFLRSVLVPTLVGAGLRPALIQTRGRTFLEYMKDSRDDQKSYQVDTVLPSGEIQTDEIQCYGAYSFGQKEDKTKFIDDVLPKLAGVSVLGVGVTEAGLASKDTQVMQDLFELLQSFYKLIVKEKVWSTSKLCIVDMDNVPNNGDVIRGYMEELADGNVEMQSFLKDKVCFLNTMVDRITSHREGNKMIPKCEPMPAKALVVLDPDRNLPLSLGRQPGIIIRTTEEELLLDISLKLRIANGTHTAIAHALALLRLLKTDILSTDEPGMLMMNYLDALVKHQIVPATGKNQEEARAVYSDWRRRLVHPKFGLSSFFITQNGVTKGGIRWGPTISDLVEQELPIQWSFAFAYAVLLRWLTPAPGTKLKSQNIYTGWLDGVDPVTVADIMSQSDQQDCQEYADGLKYDLKNGFYEFRCSLEYEGRQLASSLQDCIGKSPEECYSSIWMYLLSPDGGNLGPLQDKLDGLVQAIAILYVRMVSSDGIMSILQEMNECQNGIGFNSPCTT